jgi:hypothetical protein
MPRYTGGFITLDEVIPAGKFSDSVASGVWTLQEQFMYEKAEIFPNLGNGEATLNTSDVYKCLQYTGTASAQDINTGFNMQTSDGLTIIRGTSEVTYFFDTLFGRGSGNNGANSSLYSTNFMRRDGDRFTTGANQDMTTWNTNGFSVHTNYNAHVNGSGTVYTTWNFLEHEDFFNMVTYTGTGSTQTISHGLSGTPGMIIIKGRADGENRDWVVWHKGSGSTTQGYLTIGGTSYGRLGAQTSSTLWNNTAPTSSVFTVSGTVTGAPRISVNEIDGGVGETYDAYIFADTAGVINSGSVSHTYGSTTAVDCGFENGIDFLIIKSKDADSSSGDPDFKQRWNVFDTVRGLTSGNDVSTDWSYNSPGPVSSVDRVDSASNGFVLQSGMTSGNYVYTAIAKGS